MMMKISGLTQTIFIGKYMKIASYSTFFISCIFLQYIYFFTQFQCISREYIEELKHFTDFYRSV